MASGRKHDLSIIATAPIAGAIAFTSFKLQISESLIVAGAYCIGGLMLSPDLDIDSNPTKRWGFLKVIWAPYRKLRHRSIWSHCPIVGTLGRLLYINLFWFLPLFVVSKPEQIQAFISNIYNTDSIRNQILILFWAVEASALNHLLLDGLLIPVPKFVTKWLSK